VSEVRNRKGEILTAVALTVVACGLIFAYSQYMARQELSDFAAYWGAAKLYKIDPFDVNAVSSIQAALAKHRNDILVMRNPPWTAVIFMPLAGLPYDVATGVWTTTTFLLLAWAGLTIWRQLGGTDGTIALVIVFAFAPTLLLLRIGQISALLLGCVAMLMLALDRRKYALAGMALAGLTVKPHVCLIAMLVILLWAFLTRHHRLWLSFVASVAVLVLISWALNTHIFELYARLVREIIGYRETYPNLAGALMTATGRREWGFLPFVIGFSYEMYRLIRGPATWKWREEVPRVLLVSLVTSYYSYSYDEVMVLPALMAAYLKGRRSIWITGSVITNGAYLRGLLPAGYLHVWWTGSAWALTACCAHLLAFKKPNGVHA
jgi:hypothetical protein